MFCSDCLEPAETYIDDCSYGDGYGKVTEKHVCSRCCDAPVYYDLELTDLVTVKDLEEDEEWYDELEEEKKIMDRRYGDD